MPSENAIVAAGVALLAVCIVAFGLRLLLQALGRRQPDLSIGTPIAVGVGLRMAGVLVIAAVAPGFRGPDDAFWAAQARAASTSRLFDLDPFSIPMHVWTISVEMRLGFTEPAMRLLEVGIGLAGIVLLAAAVYDLAGRRAAAIVTWVLVLEPAAAYFGGQLLKEAFMTLAIGLVALASVRFWQQPGAGSLAFLLVACGVATWVRPYAGWGLTAGAALLVVCRGFTRDAGWRPSARLLATLTAALGLLALPAAITVVASEQNLNRLEAIQETNAESGGELTLAPVSYASPADLVANLPRRTFDLLLRPYPWQLGNANQALGLLGSIVALGTLFLLARELVLNAGRILRIATPLIIPAVFLLAAFAVTAGNAGSGYRHRAQLLTLGLAAAVTLRERRRQSAPYAHAVRTPPMRVEAAPPHAELVAGGRP